MLESHLTGFDGGRCLRRGSSFALARAALGQHCADVVAPVILISGPIGTERAGLIAYAGTPGRIAAELVASGEVPGVPLTRRLELLDAAPTSPQEASRSLLADSEVSPDLERILVFAHADFLDEESLAVIEATVRAYRVGILMTCMASSQLTRRFARILNSPRGIHLELAPLSLEEAHQRLAQQLEEPPTAALTRYLHECSDGAPESLMRLARRGLAEGWIGAVDSRSVVLHSPPWMDHLGAQACLERLRARLGTDVIDVLRTVALRGTVPLEEAMSAFSLSETIFMLEEAGLLAISPAGVSIRRQTHRNALILAREPVADAPETPEGILHARSVGAEVPAEAARRAGWALLEQGLLDQARFVAEALPAHDASRRTLDACCDLVSGAPRHALRQLRPIASAGDLTAAALVAFIHGTVLEDPAAGAQSLAHLAALADDAPEVQELIETLRRIQAFHGRHADVSEAEPQLTPGPPAGFLPAVPPQRPAVRDDGDQISASEITRPCRTPAASGIDLAEMGRVLRQTLEAFTLACRGTDDAPSRVSAISQITFRAVPIVCASWSISCLAVARLLALPQEDSLPEAWFEAEPPDRQLLRVNSTELLEMLHVMMSGEPTDELRRRMEDIWTQYDGGLPQGFVRRPLLEALDFAVEGGRAEDLLGPTGFIPRRVGAFPEASWGHALTAVGRVLGLAAKADAGQVEEALDAAPVSFMMRRFVIRCLALRGIRALDDAALTVLEGRGRAVGVEEEILELLAARLSGESPRLARAAEVVEARWPSSGSGWNTLGRGRELRRSVGTLPAAGEKLALLSAREQEVVARVLQGVPLAEIADSLRISIRTVQSHVRNTYRKLHVSSRTELRAQLFDTAQALR